MRRTDFPFPAAWDRSGLEALGFGGFRPLVNATTDDIPKGRGVYVVLRPDPGAPYTFLEENPLGAYALSDLEGRWVEGAPIVYIGKAGGVGGLNKRIRPYMRKGKSHSGGRSIWQLEEADKLLICWIETPGLNPWHVEEDYLAEFKRVHGGQPFANLQ